MKRFKIGILTGLLLLCSSLAFGQGGTQYLQSYGPVSSTVACTAATGVATSSVNTPCGGQGAMFQAANVTLHTLSWVSVAGTGSVSACTVQLETSAAGATFVAMSGAAAQTCTSSGSYTFLAAAGANFTKFNVTALTTTGTASVTFTYTGVAQTAVNPSSTMYVQFCASASGATSNCSNTTGLGGPGRALGGLSTLSGSTQVVTFAPGFTATTTYTCVANDVTTRANVVQAVPTTAATMTITNTTGATDVIQWICIGY